MAGHNRESRGARARKRAGRVCMVVHEHFPRDFRVRREARALAQAGAEVTVMALQQSGQPSRERLDGMDIIRLPIRRHRGSSLPVYLMEYAAFASLSAAAVCGLSLLRRFDVLHVHTPPDFLVMAGWPARLRGARVILDIHDLTPELYASRFRGIGGDLARQLTQWTERGSCAAADQVITTTEAFKQRLVERGVAADRILVLHNCPDSAIFYRRADRPRQAGPDEFVIIHHGTLMHRYGEDLLLEAFARSLPRMPANVRLDFYGHGDLLPALQQRAQELSLDGKVRFHGEVAQEQVADALQAAALCVVPNRTDEIMELAFPTKLLEALHMGCPVLVSSTKLVADTFATGGVHFVPPGNLDALSEAIVELVSDHQKREALRAEGHVQAQRFVWDNEKQKLLSLYRDLGVLPT